MKSRRAVWLRRILKALVVLVLVLGAAVLGVERTSPFGGRADGERLARIEASALFTDGKAQNLVETRLGVSGAYFGVMKRYMRGGQEPQVDLPLMQPRYAEAEDGPRVTWLGHSAVVVELDGSRVLLDPVLSERASPFQWSGPKRFHPAPQTIDELPDIDAVIISHDHYDHLDMHSIVGLSARGVRFVVPLGVGAHLQAWGVPPSQIEELEWWQETKVGSVRVVCTPARHFSGRGVTDRNRTLWASWAILGAEERIWFSGDTGAFEQAAEIGRRLGPFDLAMIEIGAFDRAWEPVHLGPDGAVKMLGQVQGQVLFPIHWGTFSLAAHRWDQPIVRVLDLARQQGLSVMVPAAGQTQAVATPEIHPFWLQRAQLWRDRGMASTDD